MAKEIILTPLALADLENIISYLTYKWGNAVADNFIEIFERKLLSISKNPGIYQFIDDAKQRQKCDLTKHNIAYFIEMDDSIKILTIFDTRQDPHKLTFIL